MPCDLRPISFQNLDDVVRLINLSSCDAPMQFDLDFMGFLAISRLWQISYAHSWLAYTEGKAVGVILNTVDPTQREAYSFYSGILPEFRKRGIFREMMLTYLNQIRREEYLRTYADTMSPIILTFCRGLGYEVIRELVDVESRAPQPLKFTNEMYEVRSLSTEQLFTEWSEPEPPFRSWKTRRRFMLAAESLLQVLAAYHDGSPQAYAIAGRWPGQTAILDLQYKPQSRSAGHALLASLERNGYAAPFCAYDISPGSAVHGLLSQSGFQTVRRTQGLMLRLAG
jgi:hypothetical protein